MQLLKQTWSSLRTKVKTFWVDTFWKQPSHLRALKVTLSIAILLIPFEWIGYSFIGSTLALGVVAMALSETDVHPLGRLRTIGVTLLSFFVVSSCVSLLFPYPLFLGIWLAIAIFFISLTGGRSRKHQTVTFGSLLVIIYTMIGSSTGDEEWFYQPILLVIGGAVYGGLSIVLLFRHPWRNIKEQLAFGYSRLSEYVALKSKLFPSNPEIQESLRMELAQKNIEIVEKINEIKNDLHSYASFSSDRELEKLKVLYNKWLLLQEIHERAASSHEPYDVLSKKTKKIELIEGLGQMMRELSSAIQLYAESLLLNKEYKTPTSLNWVCSSMGNLLSSYDKDPKYSAISFLYKNLLELKLTLENSNDRVTESLMTEVKRKIKPKAWSELFSLHNSRFKFSVRLTICLLLSYIFIQVFDIEKGEWIMLTALIVCQQTYSATRLRFFHRTLGTLSGVIWGIILAYLLPSLAGRIIVLLLSIYAFFYWVKKNYTISVVFITLFVLETYSLHSNSGVAVMYPRLLDTVMGAFIAFLVVRFLWADWQYKQLPSLMEKAIKKNKNYFYNTYQEDISIEEYQASRRNAHTADNDLTNAWKGMRLEPKSKRKYLESAYRLTYLNHSLLSYISALGAHRFQEIKGQQGIEYCQRIKQSLQWLQDLWERKEEGYNEQQKRIDEIAKDLSTLREKDEDRKIIILYNIATIVSELLFESQKLRQQQK